jgi:hypothetical protein
MDRKDILRALRLFNEKAEKLANNSFTSSILADDSGVTISAGVGQPLSVERRGPDAESIEVFVVTLRFFIQNNEPCSLSNIADVYDAALVSNELKTRFTQIRQAINDYLDSETKYNISGSQVTHRTLLKTFVYGEIAHANQDHKDRYDAWMSSGPLGELLRNDLVVVLATLMRALHDIHDLNVKVIRAMGETP